MSEKIMKYAQERGHEYLKQNKWYKRISHNNIVINYIYNIGTYLII